MTIYSLAPAADVPDGSGTTFDINGRKIALFRIGECYHALDDRCSHADASLGDGELDTDEGCVECPLHGSLFDLKSGRPRTLPAYEAVAVHRVWVENDMLMLEINE